MEERFKNLYNWMKQKEELNDFLPKATGVWEKDKKKFISFQKEMEKLADLTDVDLE
jgi:hypothetical protein